MLSEPQVKRVWEGMLAAEMRSLYFADLATRYNKWDRRVACTLLVTSSAAFVSVVAELPQAYSQIVRGVLALLTALLSGYAVTVRLPKRAADCSDLHFRWAKVKSEFEAIWENVEAADAMKRLQAADEVVADISKASHQIPYKKRLLTTWEDYVVSHRMPHAA